MHFRVSYTSVRCVLFLWLFAVLGPLGPAAGEAHHHAPGECDDDCAACQLLYSAFTPPPYAVPPPPIEYVRPLPPLPRPVFSVFVPDSDNAPRAPPAVTAVSAL